MMLTKNDLEKKKERKKLDRKLYLFLAQRQTPLYIKFCIHIIHITQHFLLYFGSPARL